MQFLQKTSCQVWYVCPFLLSSSYRRITDTSSSKIRAGRNAIIVLGPAFNVKDTRTYTGIMIMLSQYGDLRKRMTCQHNHQIELLTDPSFHVRSQHLVQILISSIFTVPLRLMVYQIGWDFTRSAVTKASTSPV